MSDNIKISPINPNNFELQEYSSGDLNLITAQSVEVTFNPETDYIEYYIYDLSGSILISNEFGFPGYKLINNQVSIDPVGDLASFGYEQGSYNTLYNFLKRKLGSNPLATYYIDEISADRTEVRLNTTEILDVDVIALTNEFITEIQNSPLDYIDFYLNFGSNQLVIANNILLDDSNPNDPTILIKLYEPLPPQFDLKSVCWVVEQVAIPVAYNISITPTFNIEDDNIYLKSPNFNLAIQNQVNNSTEYSNYQTLSSITSSLGSGTGSLNYQLNNILAQTGITINVDYSNYNNFIHFSSAQTRLENFYYKLQLLEQYTYSSSLSNNPSSGSYYVSSSNIIYQAKINEIITTFDSYEYYLYYSSGSSSWPKTGNTPPYTNVNTTSGAGIAWFTSQSLVAEEYDLENNNALTLAIPSYIIEDADNYQFELFVEMIGQMFDNVFVYLQGVTSKYDADNRLNYGVSKDLVADILRDMGVTIYQNNFSSNDVYQALIGITPSGSLYNLPYTTTQYPVPTGSFLDYITTYVTASSTSSLAPTDDINKEQYKRIYHNLPLLLKKKGSVAGLRDLITTYGITDTILRINEFGGKDRDTNSFDNWQDEFNYSFYTSGSAFITSSWVLNNDWNAPSDNPQSLEFRFKTDGLPQNTASVASQSLWLTDTGANIRLKYTGSGYNSGSYSGSIVNPYYQYALLEFIPDTTSPNSSASIYLPFYDGGWWSVLLNKNGSNFTLYAANKNYKGEDGNTIGFQSSSSVSYSPDNWNNSTISIFGSSSYKIFTGSFQEIRYYTQPISKSNFDAYVMNPYSTELSEYLAFRATLGGELYTASISVHPKITGSWISTSSFPSNSIFYTSSGGEYIPNTEVFYFDQVPAGIQNAISDKIKQQNIVLPYSSSNTNIPNANVLSPFISVQQFPSVSSSYTRDIDYVEIGFSPQNEINEDINSQIGYFNIGELIGDPRFQSSSLDYYPDLNALSFGYFEKYESNYDWNDYIRLIKFFDNSLFKMLVDFTPARTGLAAGIIIKNTLLDRNRYRVPQVSDSSSLALIGSGSSALGIPYIVEDQTITGSIEIGSVVGSTGGSFTEDYYLSYSSSLITLYDTPSTVSQSILLPQPGVYRIQLNISSSNNPSTSTSHEFRMYNGTNNSFYGGELIYTLDNGFNPINTTVNIIANISSQYLTFFNGNEIFPGSSNTQSLQNIEIYHYPGFVSTTPSLSGSVSQILPNYYEFNGEVSGSNLVVTNGDLTDYEVVLDTVFSGSPLYANNPVLTDTQTFENNPYDFNFDKVYYISFTAKRWGSPSAGSTLYLLNNGDPNPTGFNQSAGAFKVAIPGNNLGGNSGSVVVEKAQIQGVIPQTRFFMFTGGGSSGYSSSIENFEIFESTLSDPNGFVIENDIEVSRPNPKFFDIDFSTNAITAVNGPNIISASLGTGSATPSTVPASYYTTTRVINPRYVGSQTTSPTGSRYEGFVNQPMTTGSSIGAVTNVENYSNWFAYFDNISNGAVLYGDPVNNVSIADTGYIVHITTLIDINGNTIDLSPTNNIPLSGSTTPNPLTSNIPLVNSIFPYSFYYSQPGGVSPVWDQISGSAPGIGVEIRQYVTSGSQSVISGSFSTYNVWFSGIQSTYNGSVIIQPVPGTGLYGSFNETIVTLNPYYPTFKASPATSIPGLLIPQNFNPKYKNNLLKIAQDAGFFRNI